MLRSVTSKAFFKIFSGPHLLPTPVQVEGKEEWKVNIPCGLFLRGHFPIRIESQDRKVDFVFEVGTSDHQSILEQIPSSMSNPLFCVVHGRRFDFGCKFATPYLRYPPDTPVKFQIAPFFPELLPVVTLDDCQKMGLIDQWHAGWRLLDQFKWAMTDLQPFVIRKQSGKIESLSQFPRTKIVVTKMLANFRPSVLHWVESTEPFSIHIGAETRFAITLQSQTDGEVHRLAVDGGLMIQPLSLTADFTAPLTMLTEEWNCSFDLWSDGKGKIGGFKTTAEGSFITIPVDSINPAYLIDEYDDRPPIGSVFFPKHKSARR